jgi:hypothetical protein
MSGKRSENTVKHCYCKAHHFEIYVYENGKLKATEHEKYENIAWALMEIHISVHAA